MSGLTLAYDGRFWLEYHQATTVPWGLPYPGVAFFEFVVVWIELAPFLVLLVLVSVYRSRYGWPAL